MAEVFGIEVRAEFPVEAMQKIQVERRGNALAVVIGAHQRRLVLYQIGA